MSHFPCILSVPAWRNCCTTIHCESVIRLVSDRRPNVQMCPRSAPEDVFAGLGGVSGRIVPASWPIYAQTILSSTPLQCSIPSKSDCMTALKVQSEAQKNHCILSVLSFDYYSSTGVVRLWKFHFALDEWSRGGQYYVVLLRVLFCHVM